MTDWRADLLEDLSEARIGIKAHTFPSALDLIKDAAYNRRIRVNDFIGRAALAVAVFDSNGEVTWKQMTRREPPMPDLRRHMLPLKRKFGEDFGPWEIREMR